MTAHTLVKKNNPVVETPSSLNLSIRLMFFAAILILVLTSAVLYIMNPKGSATTAEYRALEAWAARYQG